MHTRAKRLTTALLFGSMSCLGREVICLRNGYCLQGDSHTEAGQAFSVRIGSGSIDFPASDVASVEVTDETPAPKVPTAIAVAPVEKTESALSDAARAQGLPDELLRSVAKIESGSKQEAVSRKGAIGVMQIMPGTARELGIDATKLHENALGGAKYLRALLVQYHGNTALALAAYNAGPGAVQRYQGVPPFSETRKYVVSVTREYDRQRARSSVKQETSPAVKSSSAKD